MTRGIRTLFVLALCALAGPAHAQITTGAISGRITDEQGAAVPGVVVQVVNLDTGFTRADVSDGSGSYRLAAIPVGSYDVNAELAGFQTLSRKGLVVNIATTVPLDFTLRLAGIAETVSVSAATPLIDTQSSSVSDVVDLTRVEGLPLNGRQFANLAATVPGVGLGLHSDTTKTTQYTPQISGGNGRNVNYIVDGGDNNDDTVGGLLQSFPLEAIQEFKVYTHRFDAEYGRSNGGVLNVVTKSGTNMMQGSWFTLFRDDALNARTMTEQRNQAEKQDYKRYQFGGSLGGPIVRDRMHFFGAYERTQQDTKQIVNTLGLFPDQDGIFEVPVRQDLYTGKFTFTGSPEHYLAVRYGRDDNSQPYGVSTLTARSAWSTSVNRFDSLAANHNWVVGPSVLNEAVFQYSAFENEITSDSAGPTYRFGNGVTGGGSILGGQFTKHTKWQYRDDLSWTAGGFGLSHEVRTGVNWVHEPRLTASTGQGVNGVFTMLQASATGPVRSVLFANPSLSTIPLDFFGVYAQDDWRLNDRVTLNLGVRWDYVHGLPIDQSRSLNFLTLQAAGATGRFEGTLLDDFGQAARPDRDNVQPRLGVAWDVRGDGKDVVRAGWGIYTDFGYVSSNALVASFDATGGGGVTYSASNNAGLRKQDGTLFRISDSIDTIQHLNTVSDPSAPGRSGEVVSPLLEQPYTRQTNVGWSHELNASTAISADFVRLEGRDLNLRVRPNYFVNGTTRLLSGLDISPQSDLFRVAISKGESLYNGLILAIRRRMSARFDLNASYTLSKSTSDVGTAYDEIAQNLIQDQAEPFSNVQDAPSIRTDARHRVSVSAIVQAPWDIQVASIVFYRSALPMHISEGVDLNQDGNANDIPTVAYRYTGMDDSGVASYESAGSCDTVNCNRRAPFSQVNLRLSRSFKLIGSARVEAIGEVFNLFNAKNPSLLLSQARLVTDPLTGQLVQSPQFMQPTAYAGDAGQLEQRIGQIGLRITF